MFKIISLWRNANQNHDEISVHILQKEYKENKWEMISVSKKKDGKSLWVQEFRGKDNKIFLKLD